MGRWAQRHCVNHHLGSVVEFEPDDFEQVSCWVGADGEDPRRVSGWFEFDDGEGVFERCRIVLRSRPCLNAERWNSTRNYRNTKTRIVIRTSLSSETECSGAPTKGAATAPSPGSH